MQSAQMDPNAVANSPSSLQSPGAVDDSAVEDGETSNGMDQSIYFPKCWFPYVMNCYWVERCYCRIGWDWWMWMNNNNNVNYDPPNTN